MQISQIMQQYNEQWQRCSALYKQWAESMGITYHELLTLISLAGTEVCTPKVVSEQWTLPKQRCGGRSWITGATSIRR